MKPVFRSLCAIAALTFVCGASAYVQGQTPSATPDPFLAQLTSSPVGGVLNPFLSVAGDISANGRFIVFESNGDVATQNRNNADGNRELFLFDYAQRRIYQLTNTKNVSRAPASPTPTPTPTPTPSPLPSPTPTPLPTPQDAASIKFEISCNRPVISFEPPLVGTAPGTRTYTIVFSSNSPSLPNFDGTEGTLATDGNQEIWIYTFTATEVPDLSTGDEFVQDLSTGTFTRLTDTPPSRPIRPSIDPVDVIDDNRDATISDDGTVIAFVSTRNVAPTASVNNTDGNPELFFWRAGAGFTQATNTQDAFVAPKTFPRFQQNPALSSDGSAVTFLSTANLVGSNDDDGAGHGNAEIYWANTTGGTLTNLRQVTKTRDNPGLVTNLLSAGRRLSKNGLFIAFESRAEDPEANTTATNKDFLAMFVYTVGPGGTGSFKQVGLRAIVTTDFLHFPVFTDYDASGAPGTLVFTSALNFNPDGSFPTAEQDSTTGLNPVPFGTPRPPQVFSTQVPVTSSNTFRRLTKEPIGSFGGIRPLTSNTLKRSSFSQGAADLGTGNSDQSVEVYYLLTPDVGSQPTSTLSYFTFPSNFPVPAATPTPSPIPTPTPTPSPGVAGAGLAPGEFSIIRSTEPLAPSNKAAVGGSETDRSPILPIELNGVSVSISGAAAGLYFVSSGEIHFVVPHGLQTSVATVVVNNNGAVQRGMVQIVVSQPDIFTTTNDAGGRAIVCNVTNTSVSGCVMEPFQVTTADSSGAQVPTVLEIHLTGVRGVATAEARVTIGTTDIPASSVRRNVNFYGEDFITVTLPASLAPMAPTDLPVIVTVTKSGGTFTSRAAATAPQIQLIP